MIISSLHSSLIFFDEGFKNFEPPLCLFKKKLLMRPLFDLRASHFSVMILFVLKHLKVISHSFSYFA